MRRFESYRPSMRDERIDSLKGFLIVCVLWGHIGVLTTRIAHTNQTLWAEFESAMNALLPVNYFHMALFFAVSILFIKEIHIELVKKRAALLLLPYVFWFIYPIRDIVFSNPEPSIRNLLYGNWAHVTSILWFLPALFTVNIYYSLYRKYSKKASFVFFVFSIILFILAEPIAARYHVSIPFGLDIALYLFPYLFVIDTIYQRKDLLNKYKKWHALLLIPLYFLFISIINDVEPIKKYTPYMHRIDLAQFSVPFTPIGFFAMILLSSVIFIFFLMAKQSALLAYIGKYSLPIYLLHLMIIQKIVTVYNRVELHSEFVFLLVTLLSIPVVIIISILISKLLVKISPYAKYIGMAD